MSDTTTSDTRGLLTALQWSGLGPVSVRKLAETDGDADQTKIRSLVQEVLPSFELPTFQEEEHSRHRVAELLALCDELGIRVISLRDSSYPPLLRFIPDYPPILFVRGKTEGFSSRMVAVVGTRKASDFGLRAAKRIAASLVRKGYGVVSGLAHGIDTAAHKGALGAEGVTIAVMAHGLQMVSPKSNTGLADRILGTGGALVSEYPPGVPPRRHQFVHRNRIQAGLSLASVVVESGEKGGAVHQARFTRDYDRLLFTVLPSQNDSGFTTEGGNVLVRELGAIAIESPKELVSRLEGLPSPVEAEQDPQRSFRFS